MQVMERFEKENGGELVVATLCLLEVSQRGLLETELLQILADEDNLAPRENAKDEGAEKGKRWNNCYRIVMVDINSKQEFFIAPTHGKIKNLIDLIFQWWSLMNVCDEKFIVYRML